MMPLTLKHIKKLEKFLLLIHSEEIVGKCFICKRPLLVWSWYVNRDQSYCLYHYAQLPYNIRERFIELTEIAKWPRQKAINLIIKEINNNSDWVVADLPKEVKDYCEAKLALINTSSA